MYYNNGKILQIETRGNATAEVDNANVVKDRILILVICLISTLPCPLFIVLYKLYYGYYFYWFTSTDDNSLIYIIVFAAFNSNYPLIQCFEEICLLVMSKDFRKLVRDQFFKSIQTNAVATNVNFSQQQRIQQGAAGQHDPPQQPTSQQGGVLAQQPCEYAQDRKS
uniref:G_PROTEIN_RECEP_F1_2 domain-containing protein n=1 Tax=Meloidogyne floridensis TaxID=298350 RepID=A0A915NNY8_9BILA